MRHYYYLSIALAALVLTGPLVAQEDDAPQPSGEEAATEPLIEEEEEFDETGLDDQTYEEEDDDFVPTVEIPVDTPIPFPSNI